MEENGQAIIFFVVVVVFRKCSLEIMVPLKYSVQIYLEFRLHPVIISCNLLTNMSLKSLA